MKTMHLITTWKATRIHSPAVIPETTLLLETRIGIYRELDGPVLVRHRVVARWQVELKHRQSWLLIVLQLTHFDMQTIPARESCAVCKLWVDDRNGSLPIATFITPYEGVPETKTRST
jgi:hypothetical protein